MLYLLIDISLLPAYLLHISPYMYAEKTFQRCASLVRLSIQNFNIISILRYAYLPINTNLVFILWMYILEDFNVRCFENCKHPEVFLIF